MVYMDVIRLRVSIPHRQSKNLRMCDYTNLLTLFQFLIGSLRTQTPGHRLCCKQEFQFLIGSLRTALWIAVGLDLLSFNSS